jgi:hypothetical protein
MFLAEEIRQKHAYFMIKTKESAQILSAGLVVEQF